MESERDEFCCGIRVRVGVSDRSERSVSGKLLQPIKMVAWQPETRLDSRKGVPRCVLAQIMCGLDVVDVDPERTETVLFSRAVQGSEAKHGKVSSLRIFFRFGSVRFGNSAQRK